MAKILKTKKRALVILVFAALLGCRVGGINECQDVGSAISHDEATSIGCSVDDLLQSPIVSTQFEMNWVDNNTTAGNFNVVGYSHGAEFVDSEPQAVNATCTDWMSCVVELDMATDDGLLNESIDARMSTDDCSNTVAVVEGINPDSLGGNLDLSDFGVSVAEYDLLEISLLIRFHQSGVSGELWCIATRTLGDGTASSSRIELGEYSTP